MLAYAGADRWVPDLQQDCVGAGADQAHIAPVAPQRRSWLRHQGWDFIGVRENDRHVSQEMVRQD
jgi:hypothetical protein